MSHSGLIFKLKSIGVGGCVLTICREFLFNRKQGVMVDCASSERIPIVSGVPQVSVLGNLLFVLYASEMFEMTVDRPAAAASLNRDLTRIQVWCYHWCMIRNPIKTKVLLVSRSRTVSPPHGDLV